jgi:uncharacterized membrane protein
MEENVAAALSYLFGWVTGLIFYFTDKRPFVRFHAAQSIVVFGGLHIATVILGIVFGFGFGFGGWGGFGLGFGIYHLIQIVGLVAWVLCMIKAFQHERFKVPVAGDIAEGLASK